MPKVVITGIGVISPLGHGIDTFFNGLITGKSGLRKITRFDASTYPCQIAGEVDFKPEDFLEKRFIRFTSLATQFACAAFRLGQADAGIERFPTQTEVIFGCGVSNLEPVADHLQKAPETSHEYSAADPLIVQRMFIGGPASGVALLAGARGLVTTVSTACSSGVNALGIAFDRIKSGRVDIAIVGACDTPLNRLVHNGFCSSGHYTSNNDPANQKPFDARREKCAPGEGASVFILESDRRARARGARVYCEVSGFSAENENTSELYFIDKSGTTWGRVLGLVAKGATHINAHGISDRVVDLVEAAAIRIAMGKALKKTSVTSIKGAVGSGLAAAGGFQIATAAKTVHTGIIPPTLRYATPDPEIGLDVPTCQRQTNPRAVIVSSHGVTGYNAAIQLRRLAHD